MEQHIIIQLMSPILLSQRIRKRCYKTVPYLHFFTYIFLAIKIKLFIISLLKTIIVGRYAITLSELINKN